MRDLWKINKVLEGVIERTFFFLRVHDLCFKNMALSGAASAGLEDLEKLRKELHPSWRQKIEEIITPYRENKNKPAIYALKKVADLLEKLFSPTAVPKELITREKLEAFEEAFAEATAHL